MNRYRFENPEDANNELVVVSDERGLTITVADEGVFGSDNESFGLSMSIMLPPADAFRLAHVLMAMVGWQEIKPESEG